jgi:phenylacetate-CoA ligase
MHSWVSGSPKLKYWLELERSQYWPEERLRETQWRKLQKILRFVYENNGFYRRRFQDAGVSPSEIRSPEDIRRLPLLTKAEVRSNTRAMISRGFAIEKLQTAKTGGSTGKALEIYFSEECSELRNACALRHDRWTGWERGEPIAACWGNPHLPKRFKDKLTQWALRPIIYLDTMNVNEQSVKMFIDDWRRVKPTLLFGHAHSIFIFAKYLQNLKIADIHPKGILSSSMMLIPSERKRIEELFGIKVVDRYGCEEVGLIACECEKHEGMHLNIEHLFIEFIKEDNSPAGPGEPGRIVVTDVLNHAMPLIRYQVEDVGVPTDKQCSCGRGLPLMETVAGRVADFLIKGDGTRVAGISLIENTLTHFPGLDQMQIVQHERELFEIRLVAGADYNSVVDRHLVKYFKSIFGNEVQIDISLVESILSEESGKFKFSICKIVY